MIDEPKLGENNLKGLTLGAIVGEVEIELNGNVSSNVDQLYLGGGKGVDGDLSGEIVDLGVRGGGGIAHGGWQWKREARIVRSLIPCRTRENEGEGSGSNTVLH